MKKNIIYKNYIYLREFCRAFRKCNFPISPLVPPLVGGLVGRSVGPSLFPKRAVSYIPMLLSEHLFILKLATRCSISHVTDFFNKHFPSPRFKSPIKKSLFTLILHGDYVSFLFFFNCVQQV